MTLDHIDIIELLNEYKPDNSLFTEEQDYILKLKNIVFEKLSESDKRIIILYAHYGNLRDVAKLLNVSVTTISKYIKRIRKNILQYL